MPSTRTYLKAEMVFSEQDVAVAMLGRGTIVRSTDRGETWTTVDSGLLDGRYEFSAHCDDGKGLIVASGAGLITRSTDWGATWQPGKMTGQAPKY